MDSGLRRNDSLQIHRDLNMSIQTSHILYTWLLIITLASFHLPVQAANCALTDEQISEIRFHYDLDRYMVGGCIIGATFGTITSLMAISGFTIVATVPYIATGCSVGFLIGATSMTLYKFLYPKENLSTSIRKETKN